ncbi:MAG: hypothetical protein V3U49_05670 [Nitrososphaerales archaeon]
MTYRLLFILLEGNDDQRFFELFVREVIGPKYSHVKIWQYAQRTDDDVDAILRSLRKMRADILFVADLDHAPCVTRKKDQIMTKYRGLQKDEIVIVVKQIEGWYCAGLDQTAYKRLAFPRNVDPNLVNKQQFIGWVSGARRSRIEVLQHILAKFDFSLAEKRNRSFGYFLSKHDC